MHKASIVFLSALISWSASIPTEAAEPVQGRPKVDIGTLPEPTVRIRESDGAKIKEWRQNGKIVLLRVEPMVGPSYYLVDANGDGEWEPGPDFGDEGKVAPWVLFTF